MDTLRNTILCLFREQDAGMVIRTLLYEQNPKNWHVVNDGNANPFSGYYYDSSSGAKSGILNQKLFISEYTQSSPNMSVDHARAAWEISFDKYRKDFFEGIDKSESSSVNLFNILVHFSERALTILNNRPVCRFEHLLCWHDLTQQLGEDIFTTSFLANKDLRESTARMDFSWPEYIDHDNQALNSLFTLKMADVHNHLKGTGFTAELNWISLMNDVSVRHKQFQDASFVVSKSSQTKYLNSDSNSSLYVKVVQASAIRLWLAQECCTSENRTRESPSPIFFSYDSLLSILKETSDIGITTCIQEIKSKLEVARLLWGRSFRLSNGSQEVVDYAIVNNGEIVANNPSDDINSLLSGERCLLYHAFTKIFGQESGFERLAMLLYAYLLIKNQFLSELFQRNDSVGFGNFSDYEGRKEHFIKDGTVYKRLITQTAVGSSLMGERFLESRIAPDTPVHKLAKKIQSYDNDAQAIMLQSAIPMNTDSPKEPRWEYVAHFIKKMDKPNYNEPLQKPRNWNVRKEVESQGKAIHELREKYPQIAQRIVGIDAANSELYCRPEVFAQAFRYLRASHGHRWLGINAQNGKYGDQVPLADLKVTYHVGEDFFDIVDGLRATSEAIMFLEMRGGDRVGHGLVLGTDVAQYYKDRNYAIPMTQQCILDNMAFLLVEAYEISGFDKIKVWAEQQYEKYFRIIFQGLGQEWNSTPSPNTYYQSWLLRGDAPQCYSAYLVNSKSNDNVNWSKYINSISPWERASFVHNNIQQDARNNREACKLFHYYHYNAQVKKNGEQFDQLKFPLEAIPVIEGLQEKVLKQVEEKHIAIECNPSSNYKIGAMKRYIEHPIFRFYTLPNVTNTKPHHLRVSINTDDKSIFATSLEREFSLLAAACNKEFLHGSSNASPREVYKWLDEIREMAFEMRFKEPEHRSINYFE